jgi:predicted nucleotidyltransferase component of viral defense system/DNA-directed RNA polymerase subunit RPC12/RpoP
MISKNEIDEKAKEFEIHPSDVQRDYIFGWILFGLFTQTELKDVLFLKGGNAIRKGYLEHTRFSKDLDFGIPYDISDSTLLAEINKVCDFIQGKASVNFLKEDNMVEEKFTASEVPIPGLKVYEVRIYFKDFYGNADHLKIKISMDITRFDRVILPIQSVDLIHPYSDSQDLKCQIRCMKLEEIIATKLKCLLQRQHAPDLFDYVYSIKLLGVNLNKDEIVDTFIKKTIFNRNPYVVKNILVQTPMNYFKECWNKAIICAKQIMFTVDEAITFFITDLEELFKNYYDNGYYDSLYFKAGVRIPIMEAGRSQTLLKVRYNGEDRIVEPYSLKFLEKRNGAAREYFYVFNRQGGSSAPGIRCFITDGLETIENTDEKFEPRYQIELSKAGELPENPYLFDPNKPAPYPRIGGRRSRRSSFSNSGPRYIYQCSSCGKRFTKRSFNSNLNAHKNKSGYRCYGSYGVYITTKY